MERFGASDVAEVDQWAAMALFNKGLAQGQLGEYRAAVATCSEAVKRVDAIDGSEFQELLARALSNRGVALSRLGQYDAAIISFNEVIRRFNGSDERELQLQVAKALVNRGEHQIALGHAEGALQTGDELERRFGSLTTETDVAFAWRARSMRAQALLAQNKRTAALAVFRSVYAGFIPNNKSMIAQMQTLVTGLIVTGAAAQHVLDILLSDRKKADSVEPLIVALRQLAGESIRAPAEVLDVASDILKTVVEMRNSKRVGFGLCHR